VPDRGGPHADRELFTTIRCRPAAWTRRTSATSAGPTARPALRVEAGGLRPRLCLCRRTGSASSSTSCRAPPTSAAMNMAARWRTAPGLLREVIEDTKDAVGDHLRACRCGIADERVRSARPASNPPRSKDDRSRMMAELARPVGPVRSPSWSKDTPDLALRRGRVPGSPTSRASRSSPPSRCVGVGRYHLARRDGARDQARHHRT